MLYHNFRNKDELYISVIDISFKELVNYLKSGKYLYDDPWDNMKELLNLRQQFFAKNECLKNIFFSAVLTPPIHLKDRIQIIRKDYEEFNITKFKDLLKGIKLRNDITEEMAISYFLIYQEIFNAYFHNKICNEKDFFSSIKEHDLNLYNILDIVIYGISSEKSN